MKIRPGETISRFDDKLVIVKHNYFQGLVRYFWTKDTREDVFLYVNNIISSALYQKEEISEQVFQGLKNLKLTYKNDSNFVSKIDELILKIENRK